MRLRTNSASLSLYGAHIICLVRVVFYCESDPRCAGLLYWILNGRESHGQMKLTKGLLPLGVEPVKALDEAA